MLMRIVFLGIMLFLSLPVLSQETQSKVFDKKGKLIQRNRVNFSGKIENDFYGIGIIRYEYDRKGNLTKKSYFDKDDKPFNPDTTSRELPEFPSYTLHEYNKEGKVVQISNHKANGGLIDLAGEPAVKKFRYNDFNQLVEEYNFNTKGQLRGVGNVEVAMTKFTYQRGKLTQKISYDKNKKVLDFGLNVAQFSYDGHGKMNKISYFFANSDLYLTDLLYYNTAGKLIKEEAYKKDGKVDYTLKYTYEGDQLIEREYHYFNGTSKVEKHGIQLDLPGWKMENDPYIYDIKDVDGIGAFLVSIDKTGKITEVKKSYGDNDLIYAVMPYLRQIKIIKDDKASKSSLRGEIKVGILNENHDVVEY